MTIYDAIRQLDALQFNTYSDGDKVNWLSRLDKMVKEKIIDTHAGADAVPFSGYDSNTDIHSTTLLVPAPYDDIYLRWLEAQICYHNGEYDKYNNAIVLFNTAYQGFADSYNRTHMPAGKGKRFVF